MAQRLSLSVKQSSEQFALIEIGLALKYGNFDWLDEDENQGAGDSVTEQIKELENLVEQVRQQVLKLNRMLQTIQNLMPQFTAMMSRKGEDCPDSDPRRIELFRLLNSPVISLGDWRRLARRYSRTEKAAFAQRAARKAQQSGLYGLRILQLSKPKS